MFHVNLYGQLTQQPIIQVQWLLTRECQLMTNDYKFMKTDDADLRFFIFLTRLPSLLKRDGRLVIRQKEFCIRLLVQDAWLDSINFKPASILPANTDASRETDDSFQVTIDPLLHCGLGIPNCSSMVKDHRLSSRHAWSFNWDWWTFAFGCLHVHREWWLVNMEHWITLKNCWCLMWNN